MWDGNMKKVTKLAILYWTVFLAYYTLGLLLPLDVVESAPYVISTLAILIFFVFIWFLADAANIGFKPSTGLKIAVIAFAVAAIPYYRFRYTGFKKGMLFIGKFFGIHICLVVLLSIILSVLLPETMIERIFNERGIEPFEQQTIGDIEVQQQEKIIEKSTTEIKRNPKNAEAYCNRGEAYTFIKQHDKAIVDFNKAIELNPRYPRAYEGRADAYFAKNNIDAGNADLKKAEEIDPAFFDDEKNRGFGYASDITGEFIFPAVEPGKRHREGDLVLGSTTMWQTVEMLSEWPGYGPSHISQDKIKPQTGEVGEMLRNVRYHYNPMIAGELALYFDNNKKLVVINVGWFDKNKSKQDRIRNMIKQYQFEEVSRNKRVITMTGEIMPCITVDVAVPIADQNPISTVTYYYTCPTT